MGLDLTLYAVPAADDIDVNKKDRWIELAYGRKTWFIWSYFKKLDNTIMIRDDQVLTIPKEAWEDFIGVLDRNRERISDYITFKEKRSTSIIPSTKENVMKSQIKEALFQDWYENTFNAIPILGGEFDAYTMLRWLDADTEVRKYLDDPNYIVILEASY